jgi:hypothetical protein
MIFAVTGVNCACALGAADTKNGKMMTKYADTRDISTLLHSPHFAFPKCTNNTARAQYHFELYVFYQQHAN